jgi:hypothetical protein
MFSALAMSAFLGAVFEVDGLATVAELFKRRFLRFDKRSRTNVLLQGDDRAATGASNDDLYSSSHSLRRGCLPGLCAAQKVEAGSPAALRPSFNRAAFGNKGGMTARHLLLIVIVLYVVFELFVPAMQNIFGYGFGTLLALFILWYVFMANRGSRVV